MLATSSPIPLYYQVASVLRQRIYAGMYPSESRLPSEEELSKEFQVSRATLREALNRLVQVGELARRHGHGTFVTARDRTQFTHNLRGDLTDLAQAASANAHEATGVEVLHNRPIPERIAHELRLEEPRGTRVVRLMTSGSTPFAYHINYLPPHLGRYIAKRKLRSVGVMQALIDEGIAPVRAVQRIRAEAATVELGQHLGTGPGGPLLAAERVLYDAEDNPLEFVQSWYPGDSYSYRVEFEAGRYSAD